MGCKKGGFVTIRHNDLRDLTAKILSEVCYNTEIEPTSVPLIGEDLSNWTANKTNKARLDACGFWERGQQAFFYLRGLKPMLQQCHVINENEKKRGYNERVLQVDHGTFTPLVFSIYGSMSREGSQLSDLLSEKRNLPKSVVANWVRSKVCFALLKSILLCLRGSWTVCRKTLELECDVDISHDLAKT